jgi:cholesterol transport system auxiliary component
MKTQLFFPTILLAAVLSLYGCSVLEVPGPPPNFYNLTPKSTFSDDLPDVAWQLIIEEPIAAGGLDSSRIALRPLSTELKYFADARWTERAPEMIQTLLIESFENTEKIISVGRQSIGLRSDFTLKTELREFQAETFGNEGAMSVRVRLNAKIVKFPQRAIVGSKSFERVELVKEGENMRNIVFAFDRATGKVLKNTIEWTLLTAK